MGKNILAGAKSECRNSPRVEGDNISMSLKGEGFEAITKTLNISASGAYCRATHHIPLMTRLEVVLSLPGKRKTDIPEIMRIEGVVVREEPIVKSGKFQHYDIAIFFNAMTSLERETLARYVTRKAG